MMAVPDLDRELVFRASRSGGKGGQHANKVSSRIEMLFDIPASSILSSGQKSLLLFRLSARLTGAGVLRLVSSEERSQFANRKKVTERFYRILEAALRPAKKRTRTRPTRSSKEKRLSDKKRNSEIKYRRKSNHEGDIC